MLSNCYGEVNYMPKGTPKRDGSGGGRRGNRGRGGCTPSRQLNSGRGSNR